MSNVGNSRHCYFSLAVAVLSVLPAIEGGTVSGAESAGPRCALLCAGPFQVTDPLESALLESGIATWLERNEIERVVAEHELNSAFGAGSVESRIALGRLLKADLLVLMRCQPREAVSGVHGEQTAGRIDVVVAETAGGMRILARSVPQTDDRAADAKRLLALVASAMSKYRETIRQVYAVPPFLSRDLGHRNDHLMSAYARLVEQAILAQPGALVVEIEEADAIAREIALAEPSDRVERPMPVHLLGEYRHDGQGDSQQVTIEVQAKRGGAILERVSDTMPPSAAPAFLQRVAVRLLGQADATTPEYDPRTEACRLAERGADFLMLGDWRQALALLEASLLLDPDQIEPRAAAILAIARIAQGYDPQIRRRSIFSRPGLTANEAKKLTTIHTQVLELRRRAFEHLRLALAGETGEEISEAAIQAALGSDRNGRYDRPPSNVPEQLAPELWQQIETERSYALERAYSYADRRLWGRSHLFFQAALDRMMPARAADASVEFLKKYQQSLPDLMISMLTLSGGNPPSVESQATWSKILAWDNVSDRVAAILRRKQGILSARTAQPDHSRGAHETVEASQFEDASTSSQLSFRRIDIVRDPSGGRIDNLVGCRALDDGSDVFFGGDGSIFHVAEPGRATLAWRPIRIKAYDSRRSIASDGRYLWIVCDIEAALGQRLFVVDPIGSRDWEIGQRHGLPAVADHVKGTPGPQPSAMVVAPVRHGEAIVAGSHGDGWIAHVRFDPEGNHHVRVFHEAQTAHSHESRGAGNAACDDCWKDPHVAFVPSSISVWDVAESERLVMIGRHLSDVQCFLLDEHPLLVDPADFSITVMQRKWQNRSIWIGVQTLCPRGPYYFESIDGKIHLMHQNHPERDPVSVLSGIQEGHIVIDGDTIHVVGRMWQQGSLSTGQWSSLGDTPWQLSHDRRTLPQRRLSLLSLARSSHYGILATYDWTVDRRPKQDLIQVVFDGSGVPFGELSPPDDVPTRTGSSTAETGVTPSLPKPEHLWSGDGELATKKNLSGITDLAYSPDGQWIATTQLFEKDCVRLWDGEGRIVAGLADHPRGMYRVAFSPSGKYFAAMARDGTVLVWSTETRQLCRRLQGESADWCQVAISPNDRYVIGAPYLAKGHVWDLQSGETVCTLSCLQAPNCWMRFSLDSTQVLADAGNMHLFGLRSWDLTTGRVSSRASTPCHVAGFLPDGSLLALSENPAGSDALVAWDCRNHTYRKLWDHAYGWPAAVSADGRLVAFVHAAGTSVWDLAAQKRLAAHSEPMGGRWTFSPDGKWLVSGNGALVRLSIPEGASPNGTPDSGW